MNKGLDIIKKKKELLNKQNQDDQSVIIWDFELDTIEKELKGYEQYKEILNDYGLTLVNFREACLLLAMLKGEGRNIHNIDKQLKALEIIKEMLDNHLLEKLNANSRKIFKDIFDNLPKEKQDLLKEVLLWVM